MAKVKAFIVVNNVALATLPAAIQVTDSGALVGGYSWVGNVGVWNGLIVTTTDAQLTVFDASAGARCVVLVRMADDSRVELDSNLDSTTLTKLNTWLTVLGFPTEPTAPGRDIIRRLFRRLRGAFEFEQIDIN